MTTFAERDARWDALFATFQKQVAALSTSKVDQQPLTSGASFTLSNSTDDMPHLFVREYGQRMLDFCANLGLDMAPIKVETSYLCKRGFAAVLRDPAEANADIRHCDNLIIHLWRKGHAPEDVLL